MNMCKECKLGDVLVLITKGTTPTKGKGFVEVGINFVKSESISYDGRIDRTKFAHIDEVTHRLFKRSQLAENDILFSMAGIFLGKNAVVSRDILPANTNQAVAILRINQNVANPCFISYYLRQPLIIDFVNNMSGQSAQPNINFEEIKSINLLLPPLETQKAIAEVLSSLDDKIDLLHRQNKTLEQMAETLFRQWFVEEAGEDWEEVTSKNIQFKKLSEISTIKIGRTPPRNEFQWFNKCPKDMKWISIKDLGTEGIFVFKTSETLTPEAVVKFNIPIIPKNTVVLSFKMTVGRVAITSEDMLSNEAIAHFSLMPESLISKEFLYLFLKSFNYDTLGTTSSIVTAINTALIKDIFIPLPEKHKIDSFNQIVKPIFNKIKYNQIQIITLTDLRDTILPKLISGEIKLTV